MTRYIGLDARSESCTLAVLGPSEKRLRYERLQTSTALLKSFIKEVPRPRQLCMEEGSRAPLLSDRRLPPVLAQGRQRRALQYLSYVIIIPDEC